MNISGTGADLIETFCCRFQTTMDKRHGVIGIGLGHRLYIKNGLSQSDDAFWTAILKLFGGILPVISCLPDVQQLLLT